MLTSSYPYDTEDPHEFQHVHNHADTILKHLKTDKKINDVGDDSGSR